MIPHWLWIYLGVVNGSAWLLCGWDKWKAVRHRWRVPERMLFFWGAIGGAFGFWLGMYCFRHKTRHRAFTLGMPLLWMVQAGLLLWYALG